MPIEEEHIDINIDGNDAEIPPITLFQAIEDGDEDLIYIILKNIINTSIDKDFGVEELLEMLKLKDIEISDNVRELIKQEYQEKTEC